MAPLTAVIVSRFVIASPFVIASEAKQSPARSLRRCAPRDDKYASRDDSASVIASEAKQSTR